MSKWKLTISRVRSLIQARPRAAAGAGVAGVAACALALGLLLPNNRPPPIHLPPPIKVEQVQYTPPPAFRAPSNVTGVTAPSVASPAPGQGLSVVRRADGALESGYQSRENCNSGTCITEIVDMSDNAVIFGASGWALGYVPTGRGAEVLRTPAAGTN